MNAEGPIAPPIELGPRAPGYWIRRYLPDKDAFVLASVDRDSPEFIAVLDPQSPSRGRARETIMAALFGQPRSLAPVRLLVQDRARGRERKGAATREGILTITDAFPTRLFPDNDSRKIVDAEGRVVSRWSDGLDEAVDHYGRIWLARRVLEFFVQREAEDFREIRDRAAMGLPAESIAALPESFFALLRGSEPARQRRYNPNLSLPLQLDRAATNEERANYAAQRAIIDVFAELVSTDYSELAKAQNALLESRAILAVPAARSLALLRLQSGEAARGIAAQLLAGLMELNGAEPVSRDFDELWAPKADGSFARRPALHDEILREMAAHPIAESNDLEKKIRAYLAIGRERLARYEAEARQLVAMEQAKTAMPARTPSSALPAEPVEPELLPGQTPRPVRRFKKLARPVAGALDQMHKLTTEAETVPWF